MEHVFYETGDKDAPEVIKDRNDQVVLSMCKHCKQAESDLTVQCTAVTVKKPSTFNKICQYLKKNNGLDQRTVELVLDYTIGGVTVIY